MTGELHHVLTDVIGLADGMVREGAGRGAGSGAGGGQASGRVVTDRREMGGRGGGLTVSGREVEGLWYLTGRLVKPLCGGQGVVVMCHVLLPL